VREFEFIRKNAENIFFVAHRQNSSQASYRLRRVFLLGFTIRFIGLWGENKQEAAAEVHNASIFA